MVERITLECGRISSEEDPIETTLAVVSPVVNNGSRQDMECKENLTRGKTVVLALSGLRFWGRPEDKRTW